MKHISPIQILFFLLSIAFSYHSLNAQTVFTDTIFYTQSWEPTHIKDSIAFYRVISTDENGKPVGKVKDYFISGQLQWVGQLQSIDPEILDGYCVWLNSDGDTTGTACYINGKLNTAVADDYWYKAKALSEKGEYKQAIDFFLKSIEYENACNMPRIADLASTYSRIGVCYKNLEKYSIAIANYNRAYQLYKKIGSGKDMAREASNTGTAYYHMQKYDSALVFYKQSLELCQQLSLESESSFRLNLIGKTYSALNNNKKAIEYYENALEIEKELNNEYMIGLLHFKIAWAYDEMLNYPVAIKKYKQSLDIFHKLNKLHDEANINKYIGNVLFAQQHYDSALVYYEKALLINKKTGMKAENSILLNFIGNTHKELQQNDKALKKYSQALTIKRELDDKNGEAITIDNIAKIYANKNNLSKALEYYRKGLRLFIEVNNQYQIAEVYNSMGIVFFNRLMLDSAMVYYNRSLELCQAQQRELDAAYRLKNIGDVFDTREQYDSALFYMKESLKIKRKYNNAKSTALTINSIALIYNGQGKYTEALKKHNEALAIFETLNDKREISVTLNNIGTLYSVRAMYDSSYIYFARALKISKETGNKSDIASRLINIGNLYENWGQYEKAMEYYQYALELKKEFNADPVSIAISYHHFASLYSSQGDFDKALIFYEKALELNRSANYKQGISKSLNNIGLIYRNWGNYDKALSYYKQALEISQKNGFEISSSTDYHNIGAIYYQKGDYMEALRYFNKSMEINKRLGLKDKEAIVMNSIGLVYLQQKKYAQAIDNISKALETHKTLNNISSIAPCYSNMGLCYYKQKKYSQALEYYKQAKKLDEKLNHKSSLALDYENIGQIYCNWEKYDTAIEYFNKAIELIEDLRLTAKGTLRRDYFAAQNYVYQWLTYSYMSKGQYYNAFDNTETSSAKFLFEQLIDNPNNQTIDSYELADNWVKEDKTAIVKFANMGWNFSARLVLVQDTAAGYTVSNKLLIDTLWQTQGDKIKTKVEKGSVAFRGKGDTERGFVKFSENKTNKLKFDEIINRYRLLLVSQHKSTKDRLAFVELSKQLYVFLFGDIEKHIQNKEKLLILPDGILGYLPFETLIMPDGRYLCEKYTIRYSQSLSVLNFIKQRFEDQKNISQISKDAMLAIGGAVYNEKTYDIEMQDAIHEAEILSAIAEDRDLQQIYEKVNRGEWKNLPGTLAEVRAIARLNPKADLITGKDANETLLKQKNVRQELKNYNLIHFATHGTVVPEAPELSAIILSLGSDTLNDGYLRMQEIAGLDVQAEFVNLSACETGLGKIYGGEGVVGLTQSWLLAGAAGISVSLWQVDDIATKIFMLSMYGKVFKQNIPFYEAIALTKLEFLTGKHGQQYTDPYYWAPFVYYGK